MRPRRRQVTGAALALVALLAAGCATHFSAQAVRGEIARQTGTDPQSVFELNLGRVTMALARQLLAGEARDGEARDGALPLAGLERFELAVYGLPPAAPDGSPRLDFTAMAVRGWEPTLRVAKEGRGDDRCAGGNGRTET